MKLGILGGMGPLATADFFRKIVQMTDAASDQEHIRVLMDDNPQIPDRTSFIMGEGTDPTRAMVRSALRLEYMGADFIDLPMFYDGRAVKSRPPFPARRPCAGR